MKLSLAIFVPVCTLSVWSSVRCFRRMVFIMNLIAPVTFCVQLSSLAAEHWSASRKFSGKKSKKIRN